MMGCGGGLGCGGRLGFGGGLRFGAAGWVVAAGWAPREVLFRVSHSTPIRFVTRPGAGDRGKREEGSVRRGAGGGKRGEGSGRREAWGVHEQARAQPRRTGADLTRSYIRIHTGDPHR